METGSRFLKIVDGDNRIEAFLAGNESIGLSQKPKDAKRLIDVGYNYITLKSSEIETILKEGSFQFEGERSLKIPNKKKITASTIEDQIEIVSECPWSKYIINLPRYLLQQIYDEYNKIMKGNPDETIQA